MNYELKTIPESEQRLLFRLGQDDSQNENKVGTFRGDFGRNGDEFHHTWFPHNENLNTEQFKAEPTELIYGLRSEVMSRVMRKIDFGIWQKSITGGGLTALWLLFSRQGAKGQGRRYAARLALDAL